MKSRLTPLKPYIFTQKTFLSWNLHQKRGASENYETCAAYIPIFVSEFGKGSSAAFAIFLKYSGNAMWFWPVLGSIYGSSVGWLENSRISTQPICIYYEESKLHNNNEINLLLSFHTTSIFKIAQYFSVKFKMEKKAISGLSSNSKWF